MDYAAAHEAMVAGVCLARPHWDAGTFVMYREFSGVGWAYAIEDQKGDRQKWAPSADDYQAADWAVVP